MGARRSMYVHGHRVRKRLIMVLGLFAIFAVNLGCSKTKLQSDSQSQPAGQSKYTTQAQPSTPSQTLLETQPQAKPQVQTTAKSATKSKVTITYSSDIMPILSQNCVQCHNPNGSEASIPLDSYNSVINEIKKGDPGSSNLILSVDGGEMNGMLTTNQLKLLKEWVKQGAVK